MYFSNAAPITRVRSSGFVALQIQDPENLSVLQLDTRLILRFFPFDFPVLLIKPS